MLRHTKVISLIGGLLLASDLSAASIGWVLNTAAPISPAALASMAVAFLAIGIWMLFKTRHMQQVLGLALAVTAAYHINAVAIVPSVSITTSSGSMLLYNNTTNIVDNNYTEAVRITDINTTCAFTAAQLRSVTRSPGYPTCEVGTVLQPSEICQIYIGCDY